MCPESVSVASLAFVVTVLALAHDGASSLLARSLPHLRHAHCVSSFRLFPPSFYATPTFMGVLYYVLASAYFFVSAQYVAVVMIFVDDCTRHFSASVDTCSWPALFDLLDASRNAFGARADFEFLSSREKLMRGPVPKERRGVSYSR